MALHKPRHCSSRSFCRHPANKSLATTARELSLQIRSSFPIPIPQTWLAVRFLERRTFHRLPRNDAGLAWAAKAEELCPRFSYTSWFEWILQCNPAAKLSHACDLYMGCQSSLSCLFSLASNLHAWVARDPRSSFEDLRFIWFASNVSGVVGVGKS